MLTYKNGPKSDPFFDIYSSDAWLRDFDPAGAFPLFLNVEPTNVCQLDCLFCSRQLSKRPYGSLSLDLANVMAQETAFYAANSRQGFPAHEGIGADQESLSQQTADINQKNFTANQESASNKVETACKGNTGHNGTAVRFTGWGEPLLHPRIGDLAEVFKKRGIRLKIYTNGLALTPDLMDRFIELGVDDLQFSLQGLNEAQYLRNRVGSDWKKL